jgi:hypothetical protein
MIGDTRMPLSSRVATEDQLAMQASEERAKI